MDTRPLSLVAALSLLGGCAVGPDYQRPEVPLAGSYIESPGEQSGAPVRGPLMWWEGFADPVLSRLVTTALQQNLDLAQAAARVEQARAGLGAANAALLPSASVAGTAAKAHQSIETPLGQVLSASPGFDRDGSAYELNLLAGWEIDLAGGLRRQRQAAVADFQAARADAMAARLTVAAQTADTYITIRGLQTRLDIAQRQVRTQQDLLAKVQLLYQRGLAAEYQLRQTEGALAQVSATEPVLRAGLTAAMNALDVLLGVQPGTYRTELLAGGFIPRAPQLTDLGTPADLPQRRPDLLVAERHLAASNARIGAAVAEYYPRISLSGLLGSATTISGSHLFDSGANQATGVLGLRWRLFDFGRINAQIQYAKGKDAEALAAYRQAVLRATAEVENALAGVAHRTEQAAMLTQGEVSLQRARDLSFLSYQNGAASLIDVLTADQSLLQTADARAQAQMESARAAVAAFKALGGGWAPASAGLLGQR